MIGYTLHLVCGHQTPYNSRRFPPFLDPSETAWSLAWCGNCQAQQKVIDVSLIDGQEGAR